MNENWKVELAERCDVVASSDMSFVGADALKRLAAELRIADEATCARCGKPFDDYVRYLLDDEEYHVACIKPASKWDNVCVCDEHEVCVMHQRERAAAIPPAPPPPVDVPTLSHEDWERLAEAYSHHGRSERFGRLAIFARAMAEGRLVARVPGDVNAILANVERERNEALARVAEVEKDLREARNLLCGWLVMTDSFDNEWPEHDRPRGERTHKFMSRTEPGASS